MFAHICKSERQVGFGPAPLDAVGSRPTAGTPERGELDECVRLQGENERKQQRSVEASAIGALKSLAGKTKSRH